MDLPRVPGRKKIDPMKQLRTFLLLNISLFLLVSPSLTAEEEKGKKKKGWKGGAAKRKKGGKK